MQPEIEVKFTDIDIDEMRGKLKKAGAVCEHPMRLMRRVLIEEPHHKEERSFIRIRDEGNRTTLAFKRRLKPDAESTINSVHELETTVGDFDTTVRIFSEAGWHYITYQESKRETWHLDGVEIVIDEWPWIRPSIEIEGESEEIVKVMAKRLGFSWEDAVFGSVDIIYHQEYPNMTCRGVIELKEVRFADPVPVEFIGKV